MAENCEEEFETEIMPFLFLPSFICVCSLFSVHYFLFPQFNSLWCFGAATDVTQAHYGKCVADAALSVSHSVFEVSRDGSVSFCPARGRYSLSPAQLFFHFLREKIVNQERLDRRREMMGKRKKDEARISEH